MPGSGDVPFPVFGRRAHVEDRDLFAFDIRAKLFELRGFEILICVPPRIDNHRLAGLPAADEVLCMGQPGIVKVFKQHLISPFLYLFL